MVLFVAGDIGGTNSRLQLLRAGPKAKDYQRGGGEVVVAEETYGSQGYKSLEAVIETFLKKYLPAGEQVYCMCLAVAGPVSNNTAAITNVAWKIDGNALARHFRMEHVVLINDFVGIGYGLLALENSDLEVLHRPPPTPTPAAASSPNSYASASSSSAPHHASTRSVKAVIGAGTGLGECFLTYNGSQYDVWGSEGGHADFAPRNAKEFEIMQHILKTTKQGDGTPLDRVSAERVTSGLGLPKIFEYLSAQSPNQANPEAVRRIASGKEDTGKIIAEFSKSGKCPICVATMDTFVACYGAEAGNLSIKTLPFGGLYIAGGIAGKNMDAMRKNEQFVKNFLDKGRMRTVLAQVPIYLITHPQVGLLGSKVMCRRMVHEAQQPVRSKL